MVGIRWSGSGGSGRAEPVGRGDGAGSNSIIPGGIIPFDQFRLEGIKSVKTIGVCSEAWLVYLKMVCRRVKFI